MKRLAVIVFSLIAFIGTVHAADSHYEIYYFHASWRCGNCTNAERWAGEVAESLKASNPKVKIVYEPVQLEKNPELVSTVGAKRVDLVIAEIQDGKVVRHHKIGNLLDYIASKALVKKTAIDGIIEFSSQSKELPKLEVPEGYDELAAKIDAPPRKVGVFIVMKDAANAKDSKVVEIISELLQDNFMVQMEEQSIIASLLDPDNAQTKDFLTELGAKHGDVAVSLLGEDSIENVSIVKWPEGNDGVDTFQSDIITKMQENIKLGDL